MTIWHWTAAIAGISLGVCLAAVGGYVVMTKVRNWYHERIWRG